MADEDADDEDLADMGDFGQAEADGEEIFEWPDDAEAELDEDDLASFEELDKAEANVAEKKSGAEAEDEDELEDELLDFDSAEAKAVAATVDTDEAFEQFNEEAAQQTDVHEEKLLTRLRRDLQKLWPGQHRFELEPFGSYVTSLGLKDTGAAAVKSDLDVVLLFHDSPPDSYGNNVRSTVVKPTIDRLGSWLRQQPGFTVTNVIQGARVPIVMFDTKELSIDISVQQPYGPMNSWHLRDLCDSGWPGRLRALTRLVKRWAKSKSIHTAKDGGLSSYGWAMLAASYLQYVGIVPALLPKKGGDSNPYIGSDECLAEVLRVGKEGQKQSRFWKAPEPREVDMTSELANATPEDLFFGWIEWAAHQVLGHVDENNKKTTSGRLPLQQRHIVSVRPRSQDELASDVTWCEKHKEHWSPHIQELHMLIEEPMTGENVSRGVRADGFHAINSEIQRALEFLGENNSFKALLELPAQRNSRSGIWENRGTKRSAPETGVPPGKRRAVSSSFIIGTVAEWKGKFGWIRPSTPVEGAREDGLLYVALEDIQNKQPLKPDTQVAFSVYADHRGIGAEKVQALGAGQTEEATQQAAGVKGSAKGASNKVTTAGGKASKGAGKAGNGKKGKGKMQQMMQMVQQMMSWGGMMDDSWDGMDGMDGTDGMDDDQWGEQEDEEEEQKTTAKAAAPAKKWEERKPAAPAKKWEERNPKKRGWTEEEKRTGPLSGTDATKLLRNSIAGPTEEENPYSKSEESKPEESSPQPVEDNGDGDSAPQKENGDGDSASGTKSSSEGPRRGKRQSREKGGGGKGEKGGGSKGEKGGPNLARERITEDVLGGTVLEWKGSFGWIEPFEEIDHPSAAKKGGKIYVHRNDLSAGATQLEPGEMVQFHAFADASGVGAEEVFSIGMR
mmetsp:Transcript_114029/g.209500  ORF Transcript_114029/g.209500 Transcript_114029/m.209500 type:complete len:900 (-) Transcript_114029:322-3021(-)